MKRAIVAAVMLAACRPPPGPDELYGLHVFIQTATPYLHDAARDANLLRVMERVAAIARTDPSAFDGVTVSFADDFPWCGGGHELSLGCWMPAIRLATVKADGVPCVEDTMFAHEMLHALIYDPQHLRPEWGELPWGCPAP